MPNRVRLAHVITGLGMGGAERTLLRIASGLQSFGFEQTVFSLTGEGAIADDLRERGIDVQVLHLKRGLRITRGPALLRHALSDWKPDLIQSWMYHADYLTSLARPSCPIVWGIRNSTLSTEASKPMTRWVRTQCAKLSKSSPSVILSCSHQAAKHHADLGYATEKLIVIPNGIDLSTFYFDVEKRAEWRARLGLEDHHRVFVHAARLHPQKGHADLARAVLLLHGSSHQIRVLCAGSGVTESALFPLLGEAKSMVRALGPVDDMRGLFAAGDFGLMTSIAGEAFPNIVAEAMACGRPCVVTNVGDASEIVGETGYIVEPGRPDLIAAAMLNCVQMDEASWRTRSEAATYRVRTEFELNMIVKRYAELYMRLAGRIPCAA